MLVAEEKRLDDTWNSVRTNADEAFTHIYHQYAGSLYRFGKKFDIDEELVYDAIQEVFVDLFLKSRDISSSVINLKAYLFVALKNNLLKKIDRQKRLPTLTIDIYKDLDFNITYDPQEQLLQKEHDLETNLKVSEAINALSKKQKEIIYLKFEEELDYPDIARVMQISVESARKQLYRAIKSLRESLGKEGIQTLLFIFSKKS